MHRGCPSSRSAKRHRRTGSCFEFLLANGGVLRDKKQAVEHFPRKDGNPFCSVLRFVLRTGKHRPKLRAPLLMNYVSSIISTNPYIALLLAVDCHSHRLLQHWSKRANRRLLQVLRLNRGRPILTHAPSSRPKRLNRFRANQSLIRIQAVRPAAVLSFRSAISNCTRTLTRSALMLRKRVTGRMRATQRNTGSIAFIARTSQAKQIRKTKGKRKKKRGSHRPREFPILATKLSGPARTSAVRSMYLSVMSSFG